MDAPRIVSSESTSPAPLSSRTGFHELRNHLDSRVVGQQALIKRLLVALLADGHLLVEGAPGLAKTRAIKELANAIEGDHHRIQFTPDLLPADLTGTEVFTAETGGFHFQEGPVFHNLVLADEINRAPAKVQSALLEAMAERQVTVGRKSHQLPKLFLVMATQNPVEQEGTYPLPEAQLDRFLMHVRVDYPGSEAERRVLHLVRDELSSSANAALSLVSQSDIFSARDEVLQIHMSHALEEYLVQFVMATRQPGNYDSKLENAIEWGSSPRGTIALDRCARAHAWLDDREFVTPEDIHAILHDVLRHRIRLSFEAESDGMTVDSFLDELVRLVPLP